MCAILGFTRLARLGVCVTHKTAIRAVQKMGGNHDQPVCDWRNHIATGITSANSNPIQSPPTKGYILVGDNIDKRVNPSEMRVENQVQSLHYFHTYAAKNRCESVHLDDSKPIGEILNLPISTFLPTADECMSIRNNYNC